LTPTERLLEHARAWRVSVDDTIETASSLIAYGRRDGRAVVLKVVKRECDEWRCGEILDAFGGIGFVRVYEFAPGAALLERLSPGSALTELSLSGRDPEATEVIAGVIARMSPSGRVQGVAVRELSRSFDTYIATGDERIPAPIVADARRVYIELCNSQTRPRLLHGDLQHYNIVLDADRGWVAIDPKGVYGEIEYEIGAVIRNPVERPDIFISADVIERRIATFASRLNLDAARVAAWSYAQAILSAVWGIEDGVDVDIAHPMIQLADVIRPLLPRFGWR
jgi:streptomycin 6-kinase